MKDDNPKIRVPKEIHILLKQEAERLGCSMAELVEQLVRIYFEYPDLFAQLSGGVIGTQPQWETPKLNTGNNDK